MDLTGIGVTADGLLHDVENGGRLFLEKIDGAAFDGVRRLGAVGADFESEYPATLPEGGYLVQQPCSDGHFFDGAGDNDTVGGEADVDWTIGNVCRLSDSPRKSIPYRKKIHIRSSYTNSILFWLTTTCI